MSNSNNSNVILVTGSYDNSLIFWDPINGSQILNHEYSTERSDKVYILYPNHRLCKNYIFHYYSK